jgi:hypothetical protein
LLLELACKEDQVAVGYVNDNDLKELLDVGDDDEVREKAMETSTCTAETRKRNNDADALMVKKNWRCLEDVSVEVIGEQLCLLFESFTEKRNCRHSTTCVSSSLISTTPTIVSMMQREKEASKSSVSQLPDLEPRPARPITIRMNYVRIRGARFERRKGVKFPSSTTLTKLIILEEEFTTNTTMTSHNVSGFELIWNQELLSFLLLLMLTNTPSMKLGVDQDGNKQIDAHTLQSRDIDVYPSSYSLWV